MALANGIGIGLPFAQRISGGAPVLAPERLIATNCQPLTNSNTGNKQLISRTSHRFYDACDSVKVAVGNFQLLNNGSAAELGLGGSADYTVWVEPTAGNYVQIPFSGSTSAKTVANADIAFSDYSATGLGIIAGQQVWFWIVTNSATGILYNGWQNAANGEKTQIGVSGVPTSPGAITNSGSFSHGPLMIIGRTNKHIPCVLGDSKGAGYQDFAESATAAGPGYHGEIARSLASDTTVPFLNLCTGGMKAGGVGVGSWTNSFVKRLQCLPYFSHYFLGDMGYNDWALDVVNAATIKSRIETGPIAAILAANASAKITGGTLSPHPASTNGAFSTAGDQTADANDAARVAFNVIALASGVTGQNNGCFDLASAFDDGAGKFPYHPTRYRNVLDATITGATLTSATAVFSVADVGLGVGALNAGAGGTTGAVRWILSFTNLTTVVLSSSVNTNIGPTGTVYIGLSNFDNFHENPSGYQRLVDQGVVDWATKLAA